MKILTALAITALFTGLAAGQETPADAKHEVPPIKFQVLQSERIALGDRTLILNRVVPPVLPPAPVPTAAANRARPDIADLGVEPDRAPQKKEEALFLSATVYDRQITEVRWFAGQREFRIFTNIDFNLLSGQGGFETDDTVYTLILGLGNETRREVDAFNERAFKEGWPQRSLRQIPTPESFNKTRSEYTVAGGDGSKTPPEEILRAFNALHTFYDANRQRLEEDYAKQEAARVERERWLKEHPPAPKDTLINYWVGQGATSTLDKRSMGGARP
jgi:hypothetical protein